MVSKPLQVAGEICILLFLLVEGFLGILGPYIIIEYKPKANIVTYTH